MGDTERMLNPIRENRASPRVNIILDVRVGLASGELLFGGKVQNLSQGGIMIELEANQEADHRRILAKKLIMEILTPSLGAINCAGSIVWSREFSVDGHQARKRFGIKIVEMNQSNQNKLNSLLSKA